MKDIVTLSQEQMISDMAGMLGVNRELVADWLTEGRITWAADDSQTFFRLRDIYRRHRRRQPRGQA